MSRTTKLTSQLHNTHCSFWYSNWSLYGNLSNYLTVTTSSSSIGIRQNAYLSDLWSNGQWHLPSARSERFVEVQSFMSTFSLTPAPDQYNWIINGKNRNHYSTGEMYNLLCEHKPLVQWAASVWFSGFIPRQAFLSWLFVLDRCPTRDRILRWGLQTNPLCLLCSQVNESRDHIFFHCDFTFSIWNAVAPKLGFPPSHDWMAILDYLNSLCSGASRSLACMFWQATIYLIWSERNNRLHRATSKSSSSISAHIDLILRNRASSLRDTRPRFASALLQGWFAATSPSQLTLLAGSTSSEPL